MTETVIRNVQLFDGKSTHKDATVVFDANTGLISSVSSSASPSSYPAGSNVIDGRGHTLIPGLIDAHIHSYGLHLPPGADVSVVLTDPLKCGITTVCDMHSDLENIQEHRQRERDDVDAARKAGPVGRVKMSSLKSSLFGATIDGGWPKPIVMANHPNEELKAKIDKWPKVTVENAAEFVANHKKNGADYIKLMQENCCSLAFPTNSIPSATLELQTAVVDAAHKNGLKALGHATAIENTEIILKSGADGLAHTFIDQTPTTEIISLYRSTGAFVVPTLVVLSSLTNEAAEYRDKFSALAESKGLLTSAQLENMRSTVAAPAEGASINHAYESIRQLKAAGIDIVAGTDSVAGLQGTAIGVSLWSELSMYINECGFSIEEALRSATEVGARRLGFTDRGTVEVGKRADLVLVKGDLLDGLEQLWEGDGITGVWKEGLAAAR